MALLSRDTWYDLARATNWTPKCVTEEALFPEEIDGSRGIPMATWESYDEPYKTSYAEYVFIQCEKDAGTYASWLIRYCHPTSKARCPTWA